MLDQWDKALSERPHFEDIVERVLDALAARPTIQRQRAMAIERDEAQRQYGWGF